MNARERDAARLEANRPKKKDKRSQKVAKEKEKKDFAKKVLNTIPYKKILADDIFSSAGKCTPRLTHLMI